jgi:hypothetical protein
MDKEKKEKKESGYYNQKFEKEKLSLSKGQFNLKYSPPKWASEKAIEEHKKILDSEKKKIGERESIAKQEQKIYQHSLAGRTEKGINKLVDKIHKSSSQRVISRGVLKKNSMTVTIPDFKAPSILGDENRFFKGEMNKEKRSLFFS